MPSSPQQSVATLSKPDDKGAFLTWELGDQVTADLASGRRRIRQDGVLLDTEAKKVPFFLTAPCRR